jgi:peroxiredoxin
MNAMPFEYRPVEGLYKDFQAADAEVLVILGDTSKRARKYAELLKTPSPVRADLNHSVYPQFDYDFHLLKLVSRR